MDAWLRPVQVRLVSAEYAWRVVSPDYDTLTPYERYQWASENPDSFFNAFTPSTSWPNRSFGDLVEQAARYLDRQIDKGAFGPLREGLFVYRITDGDHQQTGVVGDAPTNAVPTQLVPHEATRTDREEELYRYMGKVAYSSSPMGLGYPPQATIRQLVEEICTEQPEVSVTLEDGALHQIWGVPSSAQEELLEEFAGVSRAYIVDGHHRAAASARHAARWGADPTHPAGRMLVVAFPVDELRILPCHRWVGAPVRTDQLTQNLGAVQSEIRPPVRGEAMAVTADGCWSIQLSPRGGEMDAAALHRRVLRPFLDVESERRDPRMAFIPDPNAPQDLVDRVAKEGGTGFMLAPATMQQVMHAADHRVTLPPKATFFVPKPRSGFFLAPRNGG